MEAGGDEQQLGVDVSGEFGWENGSCAACFAHTAPASMAINLHWASSS